MEERIFFKGNGFRLTDQRLLVGQQSIPLPQIRAMSRVSGRGHVGWARACAIACALAIVVACVAKWRGGALASLFIPALVMAIVLLGLAIYVSRPRAAVTIKTNQVITHLRFSSINDAFKFTDVMMQIKKDIIVE